MRTVKPLILLLPCCVLLLVLSSCPPPTQVTVTPPSATLDMGETKQFSASSSSANDTSFSWSSLDTSVANVSPSGLVIGVGAGTTTIRASGSASGAVGSATVTVTGEGTPPLSELSVTLDPVVEPLFDELPPLTDGGAPRPIAAVVDERGRQAEFVENELVVVTDDAAALDAFVARWNGEILMEVDPMDANVEVDPIHLVRINTNLADASDLEADLLALDPNARGAVDVSSQNGLNLLAAGAEEAVAGLRVGVNWVGRGDTIETRFVIEALAGPNGFNSAGGGYSSNPFDWNFLDAGSTQDIGVTEAWWLLDQAGRLDDAEVTVAILDMGFAPETNGDIRADYRAVSNVPFAAPIGTENLSGCGGGDCPWHGTAVANAAMGLLGNNAGGAGPAGPVARPLLVFTSYDYFSGILAVLGAVIDGAKIINMSYSAKVPAIFGWTVVPFDLTTRSIDSALLFAAAGNDGDNVDAEDCFIVCWEETWVTPCENGGVICVGGIATDSQNRATNSNYGAESVDIFAPYTVIVGPDPTTSPDAQSASGTSLASPFAAGVAALIWAADPSLSAGEVRTILFETAHSSPDSRVNRYVNAYDAVARALGTVINIRRPADGVTVQAGTGVTFEAFVAEGGRGTPTVTWRSNRDGAIGTGATVTTTALSVGSHTVTATAAFTGGFSVADTVTVIVQNTPPTVRIDSPANGATYFASQPVSLTGTSIDVNNPPDYNLDDEDVSWYVDGALVDHGHTHTIPGGTLSLGAHTIRFQGTDGIESDSEQISITINADPANLPPDEVNITSPAHGMSVYADHEDATGYYYEVTLRGNAHDPEDGTLTGTSLTWTTRIDGGAPQALGTGTVRTAKLYAPEPFANTHVITLTAEDSGGNETSATITVTINQFAK